MANDEEKTQAPSSRKIAKAREEGNVAKSPEVVGLFGLIVGLVFIFWFFPYWLKGCQEVYIQVIGAINHPMSIESVLNLMFSLIWRGGLLIFPILAMLMIAGILGNISQFGLLFAPKVILPKLSKINPITGIKNVISLKKMLDGMLIALKVFLAFGIGFLVFLSFFDEIASMSRLDVFAQMIWFRNKVLLLIGVLLALFVCLALIDFLIKKRQYIRSLRMSKKEVKDEHKQQEGSPEIKQKIRQIQMKISLNRMMKNIPSASVVVTNPTHYAVALRFSKEDRDRFGVPVVVAKGVDHLAIRIKSIAREHEIEVIENPPLARELYARIEVDHPIEDDLFMAIAALLKEVMRLEQLQGKNRFTFLNDDF